MKAKLAIATTTLIAAFAAGATEDVYTWKGDNSTGKWPNAANWTPETGSSYPQSDDVAILPNGSVVQLNSEGACISNITVATGDSATIKTDYATSPRIVYAREVAGGGTLNLEGVYLYGRGSSLLIIDNDIVLGGTAENRFVKNGSWNNIVNGNISGTGTLRFGQSGNNSTSYHLLCGDNSGFFGLVYVEGGMYDRLRFGSSSAGSKNARWVFRGSTAGMVNTSFASDGTLKFGSFYTEEIANNLSHLRFNDKNITLEIGALNGMYNDQPVTDRITLTLGDANNAKEKIVKVGTGTLQLGDTRHYNGTIISNGVVEAVHSAAMTKGTLTFDGGSLKYGERLYSNDSLADVAWGSQSIKNSTKDIVINTAGNNVAYTTAIDSSNVGGLVKKGEGTLDVQGYSTYAGKTIVSNGTLKVGFEYSTTAGVSREWEVENGANLEVELRCTASFVHAGETALLSGVPAGSTVNLSNTDYRGIPRFTAVTTFTGTVNFFNARDNSGDNGAGGFVGSASPLGSNDIDWGVVGEPASANTRVFNIEGSGDGNVANFGALRLTSANAMVYAKYRTTVNIGELRKDSVLNGKFEMNASNDITVNSIGGTLTLGEGFGVVANGGAAYTGTATFNITGGTFVNNADLSACTVNIGSDVTLGGTSTFGDVDLSKNDVVVPDAATITDMTADYPILTATSFSNIGSSANLNALLAALNENETKGSWKVRRVNNGDGTQSLVLRFVKKGFVIIFK